MFQKLIDPLNISETDLREFGAVILDVYKQRPLRKTLMRTIKSRDLPIVVDSVRDIVDVDSRALGKRPVLTWFVECSDIIIQHRLLTRFRIGAKNSNAGSPVDHKAPSLRHQADCVIPNNDSLEELRWRVDDALLSRMTLRPTTFLSAC